VFQDGGHRRTRRGKSAKFEVYFLENVCDLQDFTYFTGFWGTFRAV